MTPIPVPALNLAAIAPELVVLAAALLVLVGDLFLTRRRKEPQRVGDSRGSKEPQQVGDSGGSEQPQQVGDPGGTRRKSLLAWVALAGIVVAGGVSYPVWHGGSSTVQEMLAGDGYSLFLSLAILLGAAMAILFSIDYVEQAGLAQGEYYALLLLSTAGMMLMAAAISLITIFLGLEILSLALYVLAGLNRAERRSSEAAIKYFLLGAFASGFLLYGMALVYGQAGTVSLDGIGRAVTSLGRVTPLSAVGLGLMIAGLGFKLALVPFHMWTPDVYEGAPTSVTAFMSVGTKVAAFAALGRVALTSFGSASTEWKPALAALAVLSMTVGNLAALRQSNLKRMLAYSGIAQAGYILVGLAAGTETGLTGLLFYLFVYAAMNGAAFAVVIAVGRQAREGGESQASRPAVGIRGLQAWRSQGETVEGFEGLFRRQPGLAVAMTFLMLSLAGFPPLAGFLGKLYVFGAAVQAGMAWLAIVGVVNSVVSAYYYLRVVAAMFTKGTEAAEKKGWVCPALAAGVALAVLATVLLGLWPVPILNLARGAVAAVLGG